MYYIFPVFYHDICKTYRSAGTDLYCQRSLSRFIIPYEILKEITQKNVDGKSR